MELYMSHLIGYDWQSVCNMDKLRCLVYDGYCLVSREWIGIQQVDVDDLHRYTMPLNSCCWVQSGSGWTLAEPAVELHLAHDSAQNTPDQGS